MKTSAASRKDFGLCEGVEICSASGASCLFPVPGDIFCASNVTGVAGETEISRSVGRSFFDQVCRVRGRSSKHRLWANVISAAPAAGTGWRTARPSSDSGVLACGEFGGRTPEVKSKGGAGAGESGGVCCNGLCGGRMPAVMFKPSSWPRSRCSSSCG